MERVETNGLPVVLYGAGHNAKSRFDELTEIMSNIVCFCDSNELKHGTFHCGLPILSWKDVAASYPNCLVYVSTASYSRTEIILHLLSLGVSKERILNMPADVASYMSCQQIEEHVVCSTKGVLFCCGAFGENGMEMIPYANSVPGTHQRVASVRKAIINGGKVPEHITTCCSGCKRLVQGLWPVQPRITSFTLGVSLPCNFRCVYCSAHETGLNGDKGKAAIDHALQFLAHCDKHGFFTKETEIGLAAGEIGTLPYREEILSALAPYRSSISSNCSVYVESIAEMLRQKRSSIVTSVDAGTRATFKKIKRVDMFDQVRENIARYMEDGLVSLKYIVLPGINDDDENINGFVRFCQEVGGSMVLISRDSKKIKKTVNTRLVDAVARLSSTLIKNNLKVTVYERGFNPDEYARIMDMLK